MFNGMTNSERSQGRKTGVDLQGVGMEEHIQASGGASGPSQTQVVANNPTSGSEPPVNVTDYKLHFGLLLPGEQGGWREQCAQPVQHPWHPTLHPAWMGQVDPAVQIWEKFTLLCPDSRWNDPSGRWKKLSSKRELPSSKVNTSGITKVLELEFRAPKNSSWLNPHFDPCTIQGERKGQENLKNDLVRRIKMLEYALKQVCLNFHQKDWILNTFPNPDLLAKTDHLEYRSEQNIQNSNMGVTVEMWVLHLR